MSNAWRLIDSGQVGPPESAAMDDAILTCHADGAVPNTLHFYVRSTPTVSIGYFQRAEEALDLQECARRGVAIVRRRSGGSTIYTDQGQLVFAVIAPVEEVARGGANAFSRVCGAVADALRSFGIDARHRPVNDVEVGGRKVSGSAQLRRHESVLHHGTVIVDSDIDAMDAVLRGAGPRPSARVTTLASLLPQPPSMGDLKSAMAESIGSVFHAELRTGSLVDRERELVGSSVRECYSRREWNLRI
ncbi:MAG: lipoate--protein ligase family protein [Methanobacteriota archaeon]|nr:MAG: lipoate--protein ligase family protein [Euryarchaeota archaeon]